MSLPVVSFLCVWAEHSRQWAEGTGMGGSGTRGQFAGGGRASGQFVSMFSSNFHIFTHPLCTLVPSLPALLSRWRVGTWTGALWWRGKSSALSSLSTSSSTSVAYDPSSPECEEASLGMSVSSCSTSQASQRIRTTTGPQWAKWPGYDGSIRCEDGGWHWWI